MKSNIFTPIIEALNDFYRNPIIILPPFFIFLFIIFLTYLSKQVNLVLNTTFSLSIWLIFTTILTLLALSFVLSGTIGLSNSIAKNKPANLREFFKYSKKFFLKNFLIIVLLMIVYNLINLTSFYLSFAIGHSLALSTAAATIVFTAIYVLFLLAFANFFTFSSFYLVTEDLSILKSIGKSFSLVKSKYLQTLFIILIFFTTISLINFLFSFKLFNFIYLSELIETLFIYPYFTLVLTRFVLNYSKK